MSTIELVLRLAVSFTILLALTRIMGRKEISKLTFFNFVSAISIGTLAASFAVDPTLSLFHGILSLLCWSAFTIFLGFLDIKSQRVRYVIEGEPIILIRKGEIVEDELRKSRLDIDDLNLLLRKKNVFAVSDVEYAIFETDGSLSVMKKEAKQSLTKKDMNIPPATNSIPPTSTTVIADGKINTNNLIALNLNKHWLEKQLQLRGVPSISDVFYAEIQQNGALYIASKK
ncbi:MAG: DUF421 domain-containing protein [Bacillota bacterium]|uniref:DUF421 domain-containing protein n=1 Tax=Virgibacillus salarius TaxID=447199 RepID=A0A941IDE8_9BACI|nr:MULTISPECIES: DUF421 domain-containing protein [Bacillaceae]NAZ11041.1 DUF421 domain-containing protein [Agaribacter marinus]MBR7798332.1 DUF421 domain-containing protein [Virgibacillus salarius]MCC2251949.1 DUF421 domain-containing protein [Virgibacillus sp. AGTR]MDY7046179.1 DUF421 domain-containing protein [Virgibacillus sp. M23]QRZ19220.1 DUF421 domain-containing protein [Virgibacillus sp. AGTR]